MTGNHLRAGAAGAALLSLLAPAAWAQDGALAAGTGFGTDNAVVDALEDVREDVQEDFDRDIGRFGNEGRELGFQGSLSLRATATSGNSDTQDLGLGASFEYFDGLNGSSLSLVYAYSDDDDSEPEENFYLSTDYTRELGRDFFGYAQGVAIYDNANDDDEGDSDYRSDIFVGVGAGFRIANSEQFQWSVQAGPGYRWYEPFGTDDRIEEVAASLSSNVLYQVSPSVAVTNDTDVIASDASTSVINDLALNVGLSDALSLRTSLLTEYQSDPGFDFDTGEEREDTDNTLGVAVVYSF